ncbi:MAG: class I SAM-dependent methyltransferase [Candidatus Micrarchaeota archaeon]
MEFLDPPPTASQIKDAYPSSYGSLGNDPSGARFESIKYYLFRLQADAENSLVSRLALLLLYPVYRVLANRSLPKPKGKPKLLDIGCGDGKFLCIAKRIGYEVSGVEPFGFNPDISKRDGFKIWNSAFHVVNFPEGYFDIVTMNHVLEHVDSPSEVFLDLRRVTKPGGKVIIATPNAEAFGKRCYKKFWYHLDTPRHLHLFKLENIRKYGERNGFKIIRMRYNGDFSGYLDSTRYVIEGQLGIKLKIPFPIKILLIPGFSIFSEITNLLRVGDFIEVTLEKNTT